jgi:capsular exopolysaccharide synthesis family protein
MSLEQMAATIWQRKLLFVTLWMLCLALVVAVTLSLPPVYRSTATLFVGNPDAASVEATQSDALVRTYATLAANANVADGVRAKLNFPISRTKLQDAMSFLPLEGTRLIEISAEDRNPRRAQYIANTYVATFAQRVAAASPSGSRAAIVRLQEPAALPTKPDRPQRGLYIAFGTLLSLLLAAAAVLLREAAAHGVDVDEDQGRYQGLPVLGRIPALSRRGSAADSLRLSDAFRLVKTNVELIAETPVRSLMVTSPAPLEGKTTVSLNLADVWASDEEEVVLIEADLRRPGLTTQLADRGVASLGLTHYLKGEASESEIVGLHPDNPRLHIVLAGTPVADPNALIASAEFTRLLQSLSRRFDRVILDTPPISVGADASVIASQVDGVLYVLDGTRTRRASARSGLAQLTAIRARIVGVVLNRTDSGAAAYYFSPSSDAPSRSRIPKLGRGAR